MTIFKKKKKVKRILDFSQKSKLMGSYISGKTGLLFLIYNADIIHGCNYMQFRVVFYN